jgi:PAS domain S-box-containing protein
MTPKRDARQEEFNLEPTEDLLRAITSSIADGLWVVDPDKRILYANAAALSILGYRNLAELIGRISHETIHFKRPDGTPLPAEECPLLEPTRGGGVVHVWLDHFVRRDGTLVPVGYSSAPLELAGGVGAVVAFRDVTERLRLEAAERMSEVQRVRAEELEASRARIAEAADAAMRQVERDLHDGAQQRFGAILLRLEVLRTVVERDPAEAARLLERVRGELEDALRELRELARGIRPAILRERGLSAAIRALAVRMPIEVRLDLDDAGSLPDSTESTIYFVTAEALTNVARHSGAASAEVVLRREPREVTVTIRDDGNGELDERRGTGISGLRDRVEALGGTFSATSTPGGGTVIIARVPLEPQPDTRTA